MDIYHNLQFEVPALLIQWDVLQAHCKDSKLQVGAVTKVLKRWSSLCPCGRIIVMCDGSVRSGWLKIFFDLSSITGNPVIGMSDQVRHKPGCTAREDG